MEIKTITVIGSTNTDMVIKTSNLPRPGETILGGNFLMNPGGKGANQAVAAARLNGQVTLVAKTGEDIFGQQAKKIFRSENLNTDYLFSDPAAPSGIALITVDSRGENCIVVAPGANSCLGREDIINALPALMNSEFILMQLEIPLDTVIYATEIAHKAGRKVILNPAPAQQLPAGLFPMIYMITPNETEAELLTGIHVSDIETAGKAAQVLLDKGVEVAVVTLGSKGALLAREGYFELIPAYKAEAIDTTAAGDCFNGALAVALSEGAALKEAVNFANKAASISVTRLGAQASAPYRHELDITF
jgi:ribokinase